MQTIVGFLNGELVTNSIIGWVVVSAGVGGIISGSRKFGQVMEEAAPVYKNEFFEKPIRGVYHTCRIATHVGFGAAVAGAVALTAPISIPLYCFWRSDVDKKAK